MKTPNDYYIIAAGFVPRTSPAFKAAAKRLLKAAPKYLLAFGSGSYVETWYDRRSRNWITALHDATGVQVGDSEYVGTRADAAFNHFHAILAASADIDKKHTPSATAADPDVTPGEYNGPVGTPQPDIAAVTKFCGNENSGYRCCRLFGHIGPCAFGERVATAPESVPDAVCGSTFGIHCCTKMPGHPGDHSNGHKFWMLGEAERFPGLRVDHAGPCACIGAGQQRIEYGYPRTPSWKTSGEGWTAARIDTQRDGSLYVVASESVKDAAGLLQKRKEVYFEIPKQVVDFIKANG